MMNITEKIRQADEFQMRTNGHPDWGGAHLLREEAGGVLVVEAYDIITGAGGFEVVVDLSGCELFIDGEIASCEVRDVDRERGVVRLAVR
jgi:hypothetical protein